MRTIKSIKPIGDLTEEDRQLFWSKVSIKQPHECWPWTRAKTKSGYGCITLRQRFLYAHRIAYFLSYGEPPVGKTNVCHTCDNPSCCNPAHLFPGSTKDNSVDMVKKGRSATLDKHGLRKHPERVSRGDEHYSKHHPELVARGDKHFSRIHPELVPCGVRHWGRKHTEIDIYEIRELASRGISQADIARKFKVTGTNICKIVNRKSWKHLPDVKAAISAGKKSDIAENC